MAKKSNLIKLGDAIGELMKQGNLEQRLAHFSVKNAWKEIAGEMIAKNTTEVSFRGTTVFVGLTSPALKHELSFRKEELLGNINRFCGYKIAEHIVIR